MNVIKEFKNDLLKRKEVKVLVNAPSNPGFENALKTIADKYKVSEDVIAIKAVKSKFGRDTFLLDAYVYDSASDKNKIEPKKKVKAKEAGK